MTALDVFAAMLITVVVGGSVTLIVLAGVAWVRSRRAGTVRFFGRAVNRPRLWASAAVCGGVAGLLFQAREFMPLGWQDPSRYILGVLQLAFFALLFTHLFSMMRAKHRPYG